MCPYLPSKSALAPKQQLYNNINFIHKSMILEELRAAHAACSFSVIQKRKKREKRKEKAPAMGEKPRRKQLDKETGRVSLTHADGAQVGLVCSRPSPLFMCDVQERESAAWK